MGRDLAILVALTAIGCGREATGPRGAPTPVISLEPSVKVAEPANGSLVDRFVSLSGVLATPRGLKDASYLIDLPLSAFPDSSLDTFGPSYAIGGLTSGATSGVFNTGTVLYGVGLLSGAHAIRVRVRDQAHHVSYDS